MKINVITLCSGYDAMVLALKRLRRDFPQFDFDQWCAVLEKYGYTNFWQVLNAKDFGVPQNRERVFMVSILDPNASFEFPTPFPLEKRLRDVLEENVDGSYYLKDEQVQRILAHTEMHRERGNGFAHKFVDPQSESGGVCGTILTAYGQRPTDTMIIENGQAADKDVP